MKNSKHGKIIGVALAVLIAASPAPLLAQASGDEVGQLRSQVLELQEREAAAIARVNELESRLSRLEAALGGIDGVSPITDEDAADLRGRFVNPQSRVVPPDRALAFFRGSDANEPITGTGAGTNTAAENDRKAPAPSEVAEAITEERQGRFGRRFSFDLGLGYSHFSNARINLDGFLALDTIFLGTISIDKATSDIFTIDPTVSVGLSDRFVLDADVPYLLRRTNFLSGGAGGDASGLVEKAVSAHGIGDMSVGASYRLFRETADRPDVVINARAKFPTGRDPYGIALMEVPGSQGNLEVPVKLSTGTGVFGASAGVSVLKTLDPMVVFGSMNYYHNFKRHFDDIDEAAGEQPGKVNVGDAFQFGAGLAFALNDRSSISMSYTQRIVRGSRVRFDGGNWRKIVGSNANVALVNLGGTFALSDDLSLITAVGIGLTNDSPDMAVSIRIPYRF